MNGRAPNFPITGSQSEPTKNPRPNSCRLSWERIVNSHNSRATITRIETEHANIVYRKLVSTRRPRKDVFSEIRCTRLGSITTVFRSGIPMPIVVIRRGGGSFPAVFGTEDFTD